MASAGTWERIERQKLRQRERRTRTARPGDRPDPSRPAGTDMLPQIKHIVVLMMENHSFDNYLGTLGRGEGLPLGDDGTPDAENPDSAGKHDPGVSREFHRSGAGRALPELERQPRAVGWRQDDRFRDLDRAGRARGRQVCGHGLLERPGSAFLQRLGSDLSAGRPLVQLVPRADVSAAEVSRRRIAAAPVRTLQAPHVIVAPAHRLEGTVSCAGQRGGWL